MYVKQFLNLFAFRDKFKVILIDLTQPLNRNGLRVFVIYMRMNMSEPLNCRHCGSSNLIRQVGDDEPTSIHYGRLVCGDCNKWIKWIPKPKQKLSPVIRVTEDRIIAHNLKQQM